MLIVLTAAAAVGVGLESEPGLFGRRGPSLDQGNINTDSMVNRIVTAANGDTSSLA